MDKRNSGKRPEKTALAKGLTAVAMIAVLSACGVTDRVGKRVDDTWAGDMLFDDNEKVILTSDGGNQLNPDASGTPLSVVLRVYQLTSLERFASVDADSLWDDPQKALGNTLIENREITLLPGMGQVDKWPLNKAAGYVGVAAFFRNDENSRWKVAFDANSLRKDGIWFSSDGLRVLVDNNTVAAVSGVDVLNKPKTEEQLAKATALPDPPDQPTLTQRVQDAVIDKAQDKAVGSAQKAVDSKLNSLLESAQ
ncbi:type VI secretion system protein VasD [Pseudomonas laurylsulfativorans]|uniref:type VI secretion system lipoprotein TssJ n=1 Tax=Pseudomonas laurylsulfativorans TaxID=1943631 RepID=UPI00209D890D|nr:type VI secretion system lipoprotein TssJ [Pseudomonas laurylsulfativorans]MCP1418434.1 type VI secretion system protein VasD [Pseudomonas laurylsulfativorans]